MLQARILGGRLAVASALAMLGGLAAPEGSLALEQKLIAADGLANDEMSAAEVEGPLAVAGSPVADGGRGVVYVFSRSGDTWTASGRLTASDRAAGDQLGASVAIDGDTIVAGAPGDDGARGSVYTFSTAGPFLRTETAKLTASDRAADDALGQVAIDGDTIVAGATFDDVGVNAAQGAVYTFTRTGAAARTETAKLTASDGASGDDLGGSVAIDGATIVAGAAFDTAGGTAFGGSAYTFTRTGAAVRSETAKLTASAAGVGDFLGLSVAIEGDVIAAGVPGDDVGANSDQGSVLTFSATGAAARTETARLTVSDGAALDRLANGRIDIDGGTIVAGAGEDDVGANASQGSLYTFSASGAPARVETARLTPADGAAEDSFGSWVAISGTTIIGVSPSDDVGSNLNQGSASIFFDPVPAPPEVTDTMPPETSRIKGARRVVRGKRAKYRFSSSELGSTFECRVDEKAFKPCASPFKLRTKRLRPGRHKLLVRAVDPAGNADPTPARKRLKVVAG